MARKKPHEEHENHERYLVTYSDLITLLLAFFIILYAMAPEIEEEKLDAFSESLSVAFNQSSPSVIDMEGTYNKKARQETTTEELEEMKEIQEKNQLDKTKQDIDTYIKENHLEDKVSTMFDEKGLHIILTNEILFESGNAELKPGMRNVLKSLSAFIEPLSNPIIISGHTDNVPINTPNYPSNWELSTARAVTVLREVLQVNDKINPIKLSASGYGEFHPLAENITEKGREKNRRVEILIQRVSGKSISE